MFYRSEEIKNINEVYMSGNDTGKLGKKKIRVLLSGVEPKTFRILNQSYMCIACVVSDYFCVVILGCFFIFLQELKASQRPSKAVKHHKLSRKLPCLDRRPVSSVGRVLDYCAGGRGCKPPPDHSGSLNNRGEKCCLSCLLGGPVSQPLLARGTLKNPLTVRKE